MKNNNSHYILQTLLIVNLVLSASRCVEANEELYSVTVAKARERLLEKLIDNFQIGNNQQPDVYRPHLSPIQMELTIEQKILVKNALHKAFNVEGLCRLLSDSTFHIAFVNAKFIDELTLSTGLVTFFHTKINTIYVDDFLISDEKHFDQLVATLNYSMNHALSRRTKMRKLDGQCQNDLCRLPVKDSNYWKKTLYPWLSGDEAKAVEEALLEYENNVNDYKDLSIKPHRYLSFEEHQRLAKYNRALEHYKPIPRGRESLSSAQFFTSKKNGEVNVRKPNKKLPSDIKQLKKFNGNAFYREFHNRKFEMENTALYFNHDKNALLAEEVSHFSLLPVMMQKTFGNKLCQEMDKVHQLPIGTYCSKKT